ncbi:hypothetical protein GCM10027270_21900 [Nocardioides ginkgobilobae]
MTRGGWPTPEHRQTGELLPPEHPYRDAPAAVATRHGKTATLRSVLGGPGGLRLHTVPVDTDAFGTFTGDRERPGPAHDVVVAKAVAGAREGGYDVGLASEGSFGPDPALPLAVVQRELVALVDLRNGLRVVGRAAAVAAWTARVEIGATLRPRDGARTVAERIDLARQAVVVRPAPAPDPLDLPPGTARPVGALAQGDGISKGVVTRRRLVLAIALAKEHSPTGAVVVETDLRAHVCPARRPVIRRAGLDLAHRLARLCRACGSAGVGTVRLDRGIPCRRCGDLTDEVRAVVHGCPACGHEEHTGQDGARRGDPARCSSCNP